MPDLATHRSDATVPGPLRRRHDDIVAVDPSLPNPFLAPYVDGAVATHDGARLWLLAAAAHDPLRERSGRHVLPAAALTRLREIAATGVRFDAVAVAHELDPDGRVSGLLPALVHGPVACSDEIARSLVGEVPADPRTAALARVLDRAVATAARAGRASGVPGRSVADILLDPIVFGVATVGPPRTHDLALYYPLTAWRW